MDPRPAALRKRTFYDPDPDYTRPLFRIPAERRERMRARLEFLYGAGRADVFMPELDRILQVHCAHKPPEMIEKERRYDPAERFSESDLVLVTYGDIVHGDGKSPLSTLHEFVNTYNRGTVNTIHLLPFFPYSSDRGFAVVDFNRVDPKLGTWEDVRDQKRRYDLMFDAVLNHCSARSEMFREYVNGNPQFKDFFIAYASPDELTADQRSKIFRPRTSDILTRFDTLFGPRWVWSTFSTDQVDFNFRNPEVLLRIIDGLLFYVRHGADILRLDAVTYIWAEPGTECVHLPETHEIVKLIRDVMDTAASGVALITETNVPHADNVSYFGDGTDEAHLVYNFALPPLVLHTFYREDATAISRWAAELRAPSRITTFFNILDTHDGIGLMGVKGILPAADLEHIVRTAQARGAHVSFKMTAESEEEPYEINSTWWSAINDAASGEEIEFQVKRYLASRSLALALPGVPGVYIHGALGTANDTERARKTGVNRDVNRGVIDAAAVAAEMKRPGSKLAILSRRFGPMARARTQLRSFHPNGAHRVLMLSPRVFAVLRSAPGNREHLLAMTNVSNRVVQLAVPLDQLPSRISRWRDVIAERDWTARAGRLEIGLQPYDIVWLKPAG
ncbi:MAG: sugar phosphorylase [Desulfobacterales bacterium]